MSKKVSLNDIASALNMSRNTVSKAFNNQYLPEKTKERIIKKAIEMGYKNLDVIAKKDTILHNKNILILTTNDIHNLNFFLSVLRGIDSMVNKYDLTLYQYQLDSIEKIEGYTNYLKNFQIDGIICLEIFDKNIINHILKANIPVVFIDITNDWSEYKGNYDVVLMENILSTKKVVNDTIRASKVKRVGFVGDEQHCLSFHERFLGLKEALYENGIPYNPKYSITEKDSFPYGDIDKLKEKLTNMHEQPELFVCANDFLAISLINALTAMNIKVPQSIQVIGFDNTNDAKNYHIPLTTVDIDKELLGKEAIATLLDRIKYDYNHYRNRIIHIKTHPIYRQSTK